MHVRYYKEYSHNLRRDMEFKVYGHAGLPIVVFPCQDGKFFDFESRGMIDTVADKIENGHINATYVIACEGEGGAQIRYILQTINTKIFTDPVSLMENIKNVTDYLKNIIRENGGDVNRETLTCIETTDGLIYHVDDQNRYWRMYNYIEDATSYQSVERPILFENAAKAFGKFQRQLDSYPADTLHETIAKFHDTVKRFRDFEEAVAKDIQMFHHLIVLLCHLLNLLYSGILRCGSTWEKKYYD